MISSGGSNMVLVVVGWQVVEVNVAHPLRGHNLVISPQF